MKLFGIAWCLTLDFTCNLYDTRSNCFGRIIIGTNYVNDLEAWVKAKGSKKPDANVAAFLAVRDLVKVRLDDGFSATIIHAFLRDSQQIDFCYDTFLKYVHRYVQPPRRRQLTKSRIARMGD